MQECNIPMTNMYVLAVIDFSIFSKPKWPVLLSDFHVYYFSNYNSLPVCTVKN